MSRRGFAAARVAPLREPRAPRDQKTLDSVALHRALRVKCVYTKRRRSIHSASGRRTARLSPFFRRAAPLLRFARVRRSYGEVVDRRADRRKSFFSISLAVSGTKDRRNLKAAKLVSGRLVSSRPRIRWPAAATSAAVAADAADHDPGNGRHRARRHPGRRAAGDGPNRWATRSGPEGSRPTASGPEGSQPTALSRLWLCGGTGRAAAKLTAPRDQKTRDSAALHRAFRAKCVHTERRRSLHSASGRRTVRFAPTAP